MQTGEKQSRQRKIRVFCSLGQLLLKIVWLSLGQTSHSYRTISEYSEICQIFPKHFRGEKPSSSCVEGK